MQRYLLLFRDLMVRLRWRLPVLVVWTALVGVGEGASIALLLPLLSRVGVGTVSNQGAALQLLEKCLALVGATSSLEILAVIVSVATVQAALSITLNWWTSRLARHYQSQRQLELFDAFMQAKWSFNVGKKAGEMTNVIVTECERLGRAFTICLSLIASAVVTIIYIAVSLYIAWQVTLILIGFSVVAALAMTRLYKKSYMVGSSLAPLDAELQFILGEQFAGAKLLKASGADVRAATRIEPIVHKLEIANAFASSLPGTVRSVLELVALIGLAIILVLASKGLGVVAGSVVIVLALFARLFPRITAVQAQLHYLNGNVHAIEVVNQLQAAAEAEAERPDQSSEALKIKIPTTLTLRDLQVRFSGRVILDQINLTLPIPGLLAVVGKSGGGKSTLVHTLLGLVEPSAGSIRLGANDLASASLRAWRRAIGYVPQETILFHASIRENLTVVNQAASDAEVKLAARRAHAYEFISACPQGFDTIIGDQGVKLSGGQRQRLGIARALLTRPILLLLDEAMSALDNDSEAELLLMLEELRKEMGILVVAHRLAAVRSADSICVVEAGRVVETGTWDDLMARKARLYGLAKGQSFVDDRSVPAL